MTTLSHTLLQDAFQAQLLTLSVCTTGSTSLAAIATGYTRASGSFITDGFEPGMEILTTGFASNGYRVVKDVDATTLTTFETINAETAAGSRTIACGLPQYRGWENVPIDPPGRRVIVEDMLDPATQELRTMPADGGIVEHTGLYVVRWTGIPGVSHAAIRKATDAVLALFKPGAFVTLSDGNVVRIRGNPAPWAGGLLRVESGAVVCTVRIPYRAEARNN